jgi:hypothetical protein
MADAGGHASRGRHGEELVFEPADRVEQQPCVGATLTACKLGQEPAPPGGFHDRFFDFLIVET